MRHLWNSRTLEVHRFLIMIKVWSPWCQQRDIFFESNVISNSNFNHPWKHAQWPETMGVGTQNLKDCRFPISGKLIRLVNAKMKGKRSSQTMGYLPLNHYQCPCRCYFLYVWHSPRNNTTSVLDTSPVFNQSYCRNERKVSIWRRDISMFWIWLSKRFYFLQHCCSYWLLRISCKRHLPFR